jgi:hypothetical protein
MKQYLQGLGCMLAVVVLIPVLGLASNVAGRRLPGEVVSVVVVGSFIAFGYLYKRWNGPLLQAEDGKGLLRLLRFCLGVGTVIGPLNLFLGDDFPVQGVIPLANAFLLVLSPISGLSIIGFMLLGSVFWKREPTWL